uniref:Uncharacterized protein n=1 Tax=viral metagenome TaxID=1070528 RepID=A0A6C0AZZ8_9ZZZZ
MLFIFIYYFAKTTSLPTNLESLVGSSSSSTSCSERSTCGDCLNGHDKTGSVCYWCKGKGCVNPDDYYNPSSCSDDKNGCTLTSKALTPKPLTKK